MKKILHIVLNNFTHDSRVLRECGTLHKAGYAVQVYALHAEGLLKTENRQGMKIRRFPIFFQRWWPKPRFLRLILYFLATAECVFAMTFAAIRLRTKAIHAHDLRALPIGYLISRLLRIPLTYDSHELWSDPSFKDKLPRSLLLITRMIEFWLMRRTDKVITVCDSIADHIARTAKLPIPTVLRNLPLSREPLQPSGSGKLRKALDIDPERPILLYQGKISSVRGLEKVVEAMELVNSSEVVLVFLGSGPLEAKLGQMVRERGLNDKVRFHAPVSPETLWEYTSDATVGIHPMCLGIDSIPLNLFYCLPNKLFEYLQVGIPVIVSDLPEMARIVTKFNIGETIPYSEDAHALAKIIDDMIADSEKLHKYSKAARIAAKELNWEREEQKLVQVYAELFKSKGMEHESIARNP